MEDDKALRKLLNEGVLLKAPADFSGKVMAGISGIKTSPSFNANKWKQVFTILTIMSVVAAIKTPNVCTTVHMSNTTLQAAH